MTDILSQIIERKILEVKASKKRTSIESLWNVVHQKPTLRSLPKFLLAKKVSIIAECKKKSPSKGILINEYNPVLLAKSYEKGGAQGISVLTDEKYFGGKLEDLAAVSAAVSIPVLRKDFIIDEYQIYEARFYGADSYLLLAGVLSAERIEAMLKVGRSLGMEPIVEVHSNAELDLALRTTALMIGVNNRDLRDFSVDLRVSEAMVEQILASPIPTGNACDIQDGSLGAVPRIAICESGIRSVQDVGRMSKLGYRGFLIGETLVKSTDPEKKMRELCGEFS